MAIPVRTRKPADPFWPCSASVAVVAVPIVLVVLVAVVAVSHAVADWPSQANEGLVFAGVLFLAVFPVLLV